MVRLNQEQERLIVALKSAREKQVRDFDLIETEARLKREGAKQPIARLIAEALQAKIPARQIAVRGLGYADVNSLKQYTEAPINNNSIPLYGDQDRSHEYNGNPGVVYFPTVADRGEEEIEITSRNMGGGQMWRIDVASDTFGNAWKNGFITNISPDREAAHTQDYDEGWHGIHTDWPQVQAAIEAHIADVFGKTNEWRD